MIFVQPRIKKSDTVHGEDLERFDILHDGVTGKIEVRKMEQMLSGRCKYIESGQNEPTETKECLLFIFLPNRLNS